MARKPTDIVALQVRLPERVRKMLSAAAEKNGRSLNAEIVHRLDPEAVAEIEAERRRIWETVMRALIADPKAAAKAVEQIMGKADA
jgi:hypothetical protein